MLLAWEGNSEFHAKTQRGATLRVPETQRNTRKSGEEGGEDPQFFADFASSSRLCVKSPARVARVCLTMIVKNEQENLPACLESVHGLFDEIVVVDTGSTDRTREIASEFGARVFDF